MSAIRTVALAGATGALGPVILKHLLDAGFQVTVLTREGSNSNTSIKDHPNQKVAKVNFNDVSSIAAALEGIDAVVSAVGAPGLKGQDKLIEASIASGVKRFLPSEFGSDMNSAEYQNLPFFQVKLVVREQLKEAAKKHPDFSYTFVVNGPFFDWCLQHKLFVNTDDHSATLWDGGNVQFSTTTLPTVGKAVVGVLKHPEETKNREVDVQDTAISINEIIALVKEIDDKEWTTKEGSTAEAVKAGLEELQKPNPDMMKVVVNQLIRVLFSKEAEPKLPALDNDLLGLPQMSKEQLKSVIKSAM